MLCSVLILSWCFLKKPATVVDTGIDKEQKEQVSEKDNTDTEDEKSEEQKELEEKGGTEKKENLDEFNEEWQFDPKKFQDDDIDDVMGLLKDLLKE